MLKIFWSKHKDVQNTSTQKELQRKCNRYTFVTIARNSVCSLCTLVRTLINHSRHASVDLMPYGHCCQNCGHQSCTNIDELLYLLSTFCTLARRCPTSWMKLHVSTLQPIPGTPIIAPSVNHCQEFTEPQSHVYACTVCMHWRLFLLSEEGFTGGHII